jgi:hypothetical protein
MKDFSDFAFNHCFMQGKHLLNNAFSRRTTGAFSPASTPMYEISACSVGEEKKKVSRERWL